MLQAKRGSQLGLFAWRANRCCAMQQFENIKYFIYPILIIIRTPTQFNIQDVSDKECVVLWEASEENFKNPLKQLQPNVAIAVYILI
jgi:hypothetical protein